MTTGHVDALKAALADRYTIERELGRGGMAVVYLARDLKHDRQVALKVLSGDVAEGVKTERFLREIQLAAKLTHPNILPLYDSGEAAGTLYYVMPFVEGESLRDRLKREQRLPVDEAVRIAREVAAALSYAHSHGVVHRDIKPENILLQAGQAVVADFGIARALSVASTAGATTLTQAGSAVGTPAYMSPEQAMGDGAIDARADLYSLGCVLYEMLAGHPPFSGQSTQELLARHAMDPVPSLRAARASVPETIERAVLRALAKQREDRFATASQFAEVLGAPSQEDREAATRANRPLRIAALFGLSGIGVLSMVYFLVTQLGLPDWVLHAAVALLLIGLPITLTTGRIQRRRALGGAGPAALGASEPQLLHRWFTWRRALLGGAVAFGGLGVVTTGYMAMRLLGIGPVGTLLATGAINERDRIILATFENRTGDSALAESVTEAFRIDLAQSPAVRLVDQADVREVLQRMGRNPATPLSETVAREVAERAGAKAFVAGEVAPLGSGVVLSVRVSATATGSVLVAVRQTASNDAEIIPAVDRLSKKLRERVGESLRTIRRSEPLERVTTSSLEALRFFTQATRAGDLSDWPRSIALLEEAIRLDTAFAMAYRRLASYLNNSRGSQERVMWAARKAFEHRDRLSLSEQYLAAANYYQFVELDRTKQIAALRSVVESDPDFWSAHGPLATALTGIREYAAMESLMTRSLQLRERTVAYGHLWNAQVSQGKLTAAESTLTRFTQGLPAAPLRLEYAARFAVIRKDYPRAALYYDSLFITQRDPSWRAIARRGGAILAMAQGRLREAERQLEAAMAADDERGLPGTYLTDALLLAASDRMFRQPARFALPRLETALVRHPLAEIPVPERPHLELATTYAEVGQLGLAHEALTQYDRDVKESRRPASEGRRLAAGAIALAEGRAQDAISELRAYHVGYRCNPCGVFELARAYDRANEADSALALYERFVASPQFPGPELTYVGPAYRRLGELYDARGDRQKALEHYGAFVDLWKNADPELQPVVRDVRARIARLAGEP